MPPVAWEHHYGCLLPTLLIALVLVRTQPRPEVPDPGARRSAALLGAAYLFTGFYWELGFLPRGIAGLAWYSIYAGGGLMLLVLWRIRREVEGVTA